MRVLWITNILLPPISEKLGIEAVPFGGWMMASLKKLMTDSNIEFGVATVHDCVELVEYQIDGVKYYLLPSKNNIEQYDSLLEPHWRTVSAAFMPDVVHIHGSEYQHGHAYINACGNENVVLSIQGLISVYARYITGGIDDFGRSIWYPLDALRGRTIKGMINDWHRRAEAETLFLSKIKHLIGRTEWDKNHAWTINPEAKYYFCGETMRESFYHHHWSYAKCQPHSIFISQGQYTIKGLHQLIKALPLIKRVFPDVIVRIAGVNILDVGWKKSGYRLYLHNLIKQTKTIDSIEFIGKLNEKEICDQFLKANVFVCPSIIENSSNSIGEAQLLGMPIVASYVGGNPELLDHSKDYLYRFEEYEMLAEKIIHVFQAKEKVSVPDYSLERYDPKKNTNDLINVYLQVAKQ